MPPFRSILRPVQSRAASTNSSPRHFLSIADLSTAELATLVDNATAHKASRIPPTWPLRSSLSGKSIAMMFSKRSTRTRVSTEGAINSMGGSGMFLGKDDIQLGVNESLLDTSKVISSMTAGIVARVGPHSDIAGLAKYSSVPVINALCDMYHPMQAIADFATLTQTYSTSAKDLKGLKIAWVGDANNVLYDMCIAARKLGVDMAVATPKGYEIPQRMKTIFDESGKGKLFETTSPEEAVKDANIIVTDTWISMGQEEEKQARLKAFEGYQVTEELAKRGGASADWKFMHCLPRHSEEVDDQVFYSDRSLVFPEAENRLWAAIAVLEAFIVNKENDLHHAEEETVTNIKPIPNTSTSHFQPHVLEMESPTLSRSPSATFAPSSRGRRSQTNIHHLSLAPLTPKYPVDPADYDAYFDPTTSALHTSTSLSRISGVPSPGGILSPAQSRGNSKSRLRRKNKSTVSIRAPNDIPSGALTSEGFGHKKQLRIHADSSWLVQTGLALTEGSLETKGQSWITKRDSSTSLHNPEDYPRSGRATPRSRSRRRSRKGLSMTPAMITPFEEAEPDWADSQTQAEIAAQVENDLADEFDDDGDDRYGLLDFEANFSEDEEEVREAIAQGKSWLDGVIDVFLKLEDDPPEDDLESARGSGDVVSDVEPPPNAPKGLWDDVAWFGRLLARTVRS